MQTAGFLVFHCNAEIPAVDTAFDRGEDYSAVVFHNDIAAVPEDAVQETRSLSEAPFVLFQNPTIASNEEEFDLVIPALTPPDLWLQKLREVIHASRKLREDGAAVRSPSQSLRLKSSRNRILPIDPEALWRGSDSDGLPDAKPPEESRPGKFGEKAG